MHLNVEIKARVSDPSRIRKYLVDHHASYKGVDLQTDTYFNVRNGRLKLREGNIENNLIFYQRENKEGPKNSNFDLLRVDDQARLKAVLVKSIGIKTVVTKTREIYYMDNVKFHIDRIEGLGDFIEIEAGNLLAPALREADLKKQCEHYISEFRIRPEDLVHHSYSDMLMGNP
jgi:adenylate cyclase class 2